MKQIFYRFLTLLFGAWLSACSAPQKVDVSEERIFRITHADSSGRMFSEIWTKPKFESLGVEKISSKYFDRGMHFEDSKFSAISFTQLLKQFKLKRGEDAVLLNCFDDYQGILSLNDIHRYDVRLATKITLTFGSDKPSWLDPLLILVPDSKQPPFQERFLTANIRELKFVKLNEYYAPLKEIADHSLETAEGFEVYKNNCLFCHSLKGRGGNKGVRFMKAYDFSQESDRLQMLGDFKSFHENSIDQFVTEKKLERVVDFLGAVQKSLVD